MLEVLRRHPLLVLFVLALAAGNYSHQSGTPSPTTEAGLRVMVIEDVTQRDKLPREQLEQLTSEADESLITWLRANAKEWRIVDQAADVSQDSPGAQQLFAVKRDAVPWIVAGNGRRGISERVAADVGPCGVRSGVG